MIDIKWGEFNDNAAYSRQKRKCLLRFSGNSVSFKNHWGAYTRYFLKWNKRAFAVCLPCKTREGESIKWIFGWRLHDKIDFKTDKRDPVLLEIHFYKVEVVFYR